MHLKFCFEGTPTNTSPAAMLRYYRLRKGLTTRQLAEKVGIAPATLLMYERGKFSLPYQTALDIAKILEINKKLLFDDFARFMDFPYFEILCLVRKAYDLSQKNFANKAGINFSIYTKWESGARKPSRKMYYQLVDVFPELKV